MKQVNLSVFADEHLFYEAWMFTEARSMQFANQFESNLRTEACALHFRNLCEFFYPPAKKEKDDVNANCYVAKWAEKRPEITPVLIECRKRANKELAHLTSERIIGTPEKKKWPIEQISVDMRAVVSAFLDLQPNITAKTISQLREI